MFCMAEVRRKKGHKQRISSVIGLSAQENYSAQTSSADLQYFWSLVRKIAKKFKGTK